MSNLDQQNRSLVLLGGGGHSAVVAETALSQGWELLGFGDDVVRELLPGVPYLDSIEQAIAHAQQHSAAIHAAAGDAALRRTWNDAAVDLVRATVIHPQAVVSESAQIDSGVFVSAAAVINTRVSIRTGAIINTAAIVEHDCVVGAYSHISPRAVLTGGVQVGADCMIGAGAIVLPGRLIGDGTTVGAGAVVIEDVPAGATVVGVPARSLGVLSM